MIGDNNNSAGLIGLQTGLDFGTGLLNTAIGMAYNNYMQQKQWDREDTSIFRRKQDALNAGINPLWVLGQGSNSPSSGLLPLSIGGIQTSPNAVATAKDVELKQKEQEHYQKNDNIRLLNELKLSDASIEQISAQIENANADTQKKIKEALLITKETGLTSQKIATEILTQKSIQAAIDKNEHQINHLKQLTKSEEFKQKLIKAETILTHHQTQLSQVQMRELYQKIAVMKSEEDLNKIEYWLTATKIGSEAVHTIMDVVKMFMPTANIPKTTEIFSETVKSKGKTSYYERRVAN